MVKIEIVRSLVHKIKKTFDNKEANTVLDLIESISPKGGKPLGNVGSLVIKEIRYKKFRFYFIADGYKLKFFSEEELTDLLLRFVRMSDKKHQQETINKIKLILIELGPSGLM